MLNFFTPPGQPKEMYCRPLLLAMCFLGSLFPTACQNRQQSQLQQDTPLREVKTAREYVDVPFRKSLTKGEWERSYEGLFSLHDTNPTSAAEVVKVAPRITLTSFPQPAQDQRILRLGIGAVNPTQLGDKPLRLALVPSGEFHSLLFARAVSSALKTLNNKNLFKNIASRVPGSPISHPSLPWSIGYKAKSSRGGRLELRVHFDGKKLWLEVKARTYEASLENADFLEPKESFQATDRVTFDIPLVDTIYPFLSGFWDILADGDPDSPSFDPLRGAFLNLVQNSAHRWYDVKIRVAEANKLAEVNVFENHRDGQLRKEPLLSAPGSFQGTFHWLATLDSLATTFGEGGVEDYVVDYNYSNPGEKGTAFVNSRVVDGVPRMYHRSVTVPKPLTDIDRNTPPEELNPSRELLVKWNYPLDRAHPVTSVAVDQNSNFCTENCAKASFSVTASRAAARVAAQKEVRVIVSLVKPSEGNTATNAADLARGLVNFDYLKSARFTASGETAGVSLSTSEPISVKVPTPVHPGYHIVFAFADINGDGWFQAEEPISTNIIPKLIEAPESTVELKLGLLNDVVAN